MKAPDLLQMEEGILTPDDVILDDTAPTESKLSLSFDGMSGGMSGGVSVDMSGSMSGGMSEKPSDSLDQVDGAVAINMEQETSFCSAKPDIQSEPKTELEMLQQTITDVQSLDGQLFETKVQYHNDMIEYRRKLYRVYKTHRLSIGKAKPYFVAKTLENTLMEECWHAKQECEQAKVNFDDTKEKEAFTHQVLDSARAEKGAVQEASDTVVLENWNNATKRVLETSKLRADAEDTYRRKEEQLFAANKSADLLFEELRKDVDKAWPYYAMKDAYEKELEGKRRHIRDTGRRLSVAMESYNEAISVVTGEKNKSQPVADLDFGMVSSRDIGKNLPDELDSILSTLESKADDLSSSFNSMTKDFDMEEAELDLNATSDLAPASEVSPKKDEASPPPKQKMVRSKSVFAILFPSSKLQEAPPPDVRPKRKLLKEKGRSLSLASFTLPFTKGYEKMKD